MGRWVYRRPYFRVARPKIPLHRGQAPFAALRHLRAVRQRRHIIARRVVHVLGFTQQANNLTHPPVRRPLVRFKPPKKPAIRRILVPATPFVGKQGPIARMLKAVQRARRHIQARLRWKPRPEEFPPIIVPTAPVHAIPRGDVFTAGAVEAAVFTAGAKRGKVGGKRG